MSRAFSHQSTLSTAFAYFFNGQDSSRSWFWWDAKPLASSGIIKKKQHAVPLEAAAVMCMVTLAPPEPWPISVTSFGSPPKRPMLFCTQRSARFWSHRPMLPGASSDSSDRNPATVSGQKNEETNENKKRNQRHSRLKMASRWYGLKKGLRQWKFKFL